MRLCRLACAKFANASGRNRAPKADHQAPRQPPSRFRDLRPQHGRSGHQAIGSERRRNDGHHKQSPRAVHKLNSMPPDHRGRQGNARIITNLRPRRSLAYCATCATGVLSARAHPEHWRTSRQWRMPITSAVGCPSQAAAAWSRPGSADSPPVRRPLIPCSCRIRSWASGRDHPQPGGLI